MSARPQHIASLTPLRGIAAILVIVFHIESIISFQQLGPVIQGTGLLIRGYLWVDFFFVLSGFIMTHVYGQRFTEAYDRKTVKDYVRARLARIYPLHMFLLAVLAVLYVFVFSKMGGPDSAEFYDWKALPLHVFLLLGFGITPLAWNFPAWSISVEWWTYLLAIPLFKVLNKGVSWKTYAAAALSVGTLMFVIARSTVKTLDVTQDFGFIRCVCDFVVGMCTYQFYRASQGGKRFTTDGVFFVALLCMMALLHFGAPEPPKPGGFNPPIASPLALYLDAISPVFFGFLILCASYNEGIVAKLLNLKPMQYLGDISYSIYMGQALVFNWLFAYSGMYRKEHPTGLMDIKSFAFLTSTVVGGTIILAVMTYHGVELPARRWLRGRPNSDAASA